MSVTVSLINMKGGVGKTTLAFNLSWYCAWQANLKVLAVDLDPQANLSQYFMGANEYLKYLNEDKKTVLDIFEQFSALRTRETSSTALSPSKVVHKLHEWRDGSLLYLIPSRLELAWTLQNPTGKEQLLQQFLDKTSNNYDLIIIDCAPTESILTIAAYRASKCVFVPVRPEFLATIGLPLLARSLKDFCLRYEGQMIEMGGIIFNAKRRTNPPPEQDKSCADVRKLANKFEWSVFNNEAFYSDSYPTGSRDGKPIFQTEYARNYVKDELRAVAEEFLRAIELR